MVGQSTKSTSCRNHYVLLRLRATCPLRIARMSMGLFLVHYDMKIFEGLPFFFPYELLLTPQMLRKVQALKAVKVGYIFQSDMLKNQTSCNERHISISLDRFFFFSPTISTDRIVYNPKKGVVFLLSIIFPLFTRFPWIFRRKTEVTNHSTNRLVHTSVLAQLFNVFIIFEGVYETI